LNVRRIDKSSGPAQIVQSGQPDPAEDQAANYRLLIMQQKMPGSHRCFGSNSCTALSVLCGFAGGTYSV